MFRSLEETFQRVEPTYRGGAAFTSFESLAAMFANVLVGIGISIGVIGMAYGFIQSATSLGDAKHMLNARYAVLLGGVALMVSLLAWAIKGAVFKTVGL